MDGSMFRGLGTALVVLLLAIGVAGVGCGACGVWYVQSHYDIQVKRK